MYTCSLFAIYLVLIVPSRSSCLCHLFFFTHTAPTEIYTLSLHDALPISVFGGTPIWPHASSASIATRSRRDRKSTRLNSSHTVISYAVFCLKKKKKQTIR